MSSPLPSGPDWDGSGWNPEGVGVGRAAPLSDPLVPPDLRGWFDRVVGVVQRSLMPLLGIQFCVAMVVTLISHAVAPSLTAQAGGGVGLTGLPPVTSTGQAAVADPFDSMSALLGLAVTFCVSAFGQCASVFVAIRDAAGRPLSAKQALRFAARQAPALIGWELFAGMLMAFGLLVLIVPGLYLATVFGASLVGVVTVERGTPTRCFQLVNRRLWPTAGRMALAAAAVAYGFLGSYVVSALSAPGSFNEAVLQALVSLPAGIVTVGVVIVSYAELRFHESGTAVTQTLADELDR
jgi:hypothetical protein